MIKLFLDDERFPNEVVWGIDAEIYQDPHWFIVRNYDQFVYFITTNGIPDLISFDNDLGEEKEGIDCVKWLMNYCIDNKKKIKDYKAHSFNSVNRINILKDLDWFNKNYDKFF